MPDYAETIKRLQAAAKNQVLPLPGVGEEDMEDPQSLLAEGVIDRADANEAAERKRKVCNFLFRICIITYTMMLNMQFSF